ncbi:Aldo-keto reductase [Gulosibacter sp. 10]|nr:aldo/keto reductase [Gulosibacter sp. 10]SJM63989.1 Aldo-keto reductase [Gulosibacter sp. 10]
MAGRTRSSFRTSSIDDRVELGPGLVVPPQGYGAMSLTDIYGAVDEKDALATLAHAVDAGATLIDTANIYGDGRSERIISRLLASRRDEVQVATKVGIVPSGTPGKRKASNDRRHIREQIDLSLRRLGTDHVDLYYLHRIDPEVPIEESVGTLAELVDEGKIRHIGLSEATGDELRRASAVHPIAAVQSEWNIISRDVEPGVVPAARELGIAFVAYSPLSRQWLTGRYDPTRCEEGDSRPQIFPRFAPEALRANQPVLEEVLAVARELDASPAQVALAWVHGKAAELELPVVTIPGTRLPERVDENIAALGIALQQVHLGRLEPLADRIEGSRSFDPAWISSGRE